MSENVDSNAPHKKRAIDSSTDTKYLSSDANIVDRAYEIIEPILEDKMTPEHAKDLSRSDAVTFIEGIINDVVKSHRLQINDLERRDLTTVLLNDLISVGG